MFSIAFDLDYNETVGRHPAGVRQAYREIERTLARYDFRRVQQSVYLTDSDDLANLAAAMNALKALVWFPDCVRDIRGFRVENWSDFTPLMKSNR